jgi:hypothetical protein
VTTIHSIATPLVALIKMGGGAPIMSVDVESMFEQKCVSDPIAQWAVPYLVAYRLSVSAKSEI